MNRNIKHSGETDPIPIMSPFRELNMEKKSDKTFSSQFQLIEFEVNSQELHKSP